MWCITSYAVLAKAHIFHVNMLTTVSDRPPILFTLSATIQISVPIGPHDQNAYHCYVLDSQWCWVYYKMISSLHTVQFFFLTYPESSKFAWLLTFTLRIEKSNFLIYVFVYEVLKCYRCSNRCRHPSQCDISNISCFHTFPSFGLSVLLVK